MLINIVKAKLNRIKELTTNYTILKKVSKSNKKMNLLIKPVMIGKIALNHI